MSVRLYATAVISTLAILRARGKMCAQFMEALMINDYTDRHHRFEGCFNFRDIGGYPAANGQRVRWGRYYRAGRQDRMTAADKDRLSKLAISTQIDLRQQHEIDEQGRGPLPSQGASYHHIPVIPSGGGERLNRLVGDTGISGKRYLGYLEFGPEPWLKMFELFADAAEHPVLIHCTAGKDRTGVSTAFLLSVLGVDRGIIEADYVLTNIDVPRQIEFLEATNALPEDLDVQTMKVLAGVPENAMGDFLDGLADRWGGPVGYLEAIGVPTTTFEKVRAAFLE